MTPRPLRVLLVEDSVSDAELMIKQLERDGFDPAWRRVSSRDEYAKELLWGPDIILADYGVPGFGAVMALSDLQSMQLDIPFIVVSGTLGEEVAVAILREGAADYLLKDRIQRLGEAVTRAIEQRRLRQELFESEKRYRSVFEDSPNPMWVYDTHTFRFLAVNDAAVEHYGYSKDEFLGMTLFDIRSPDQATALAAVAETAKRFRQAGVFKHRKKDGTPIEVRVESHDLVHYGRPARVALVTDITGQRRAEEALRETQERTRYALEAGGVGIWDMDPRTGIATWSEVLQVMHGLEPGTFGGTFKAFVARIAEDDRATVLAALDQSFKNRTDSNIEYRTVRPDGSTHWIVSKGRVVLNEAGEPVRVIGIGIDVTERHQLEAQLLQSQKMEAIGQLAGGVAHDFNNLLTAILGYSELLLPVVKGSDRHATDLDQIRKSATRATHLTRQLLAFSRRQILQPTVLDLNALMAEIGSLLRRLLGEDVELKLKPDPQLGRVKADPGQIEQVIMNLAVNARDAMPRGGCLTIQTANYDADDHFFRRHGITHREVARRFVALFVSDTGTGMDAETKKHIFEPFFTTKPKGKGTGLGLATVYGIVKQSGGWIWVYSEPGSGTTFKVYLPRTDEEFPRELIVAPVDAAISGSETILLVEDEEAVRLLSQDLLERWGYRVVAASDAEDAIRIAETESRSIDLLLTDVVMPGQSGPELFERLRPRRPGLKVLYVSGYTDEAIVSRGVLTPETPFLQKPFTASGLTRKVRQVLDGTVAT